MLHVRTSLVPTFSSTSVRSTIQRFTTLIVSSIEKERGISPISWLIMIVSIKDKPYSLNYMVTFSTTCILFDEDPGRTVLTYFNFAAHWRPTTTEQTLSFFGKYILTKTLSLTSRLIKRQTDRLIGEDAGRRVKAAVASLLVRNFLSDTRTNSEN